jgi:hypothetical protein
MQNIRSKQKKVPLFDLLLITSQFDSILLMRKALYLHLYNLGASDLQLEWIDLWFPTIDIHSCQHIQIWMPSWIFHRLFQGKDLRSLDWKILAAFLASKVPLEWDLYMFWVPNHPCNLQSLYSHSWWTLSLQKLES